MDELTLAIYQGNGHTGLPAKNRELLLKLIAQANQAGAKLLLCPELFITGYNIGHAKTHELAETATGPSYQAVRAAAQKYSVAVIYGFPERTEYGEGKPILVYNSINVVDQDGSLQQTYRKTHLFGSEEKAIFKPGDRLGPLVDLVGWKVGTLICYDVEVPEAVRTLRQQGAELICVPTANMLPYQQVNRTLVRARAMENHVYVAYANHAGEENGIVFCGESVVYEPDGQVLVHMDPETNGLEFTTISKSHLEPPEEYNYLEDLRPELYNTAGCLTKWLKTNRVPCALATAGALAILAAQITRFHQRQ